MRRELRRKEGQRETFTGVFVRLGTKSDWHAPQTTILLKDIRDAEGNVVADHLWFNMTKGFEALGELHEGDVIQFDARVTEYEKGYKGRRWDVYKPVKRDYRLSRPTKVRRVEADGGDQ